MVNINELRISPDGTKLYIDVNVKDLDYFKNVFLDKLYIDTQDTFKQYVPSETAYSMPLTSESGFNEYIAISEEDFPNDATYKYIRENVIYELVDLDPHKLYDFESLSGETFDWYGINNIYYKYIYENSNFINIDTKRFKAVIDLDRFDLKGNNLLFIRIKTKGTPSPDTPCGEDNVYTLGVVTNLYPMYQQAFNYIKELSNTCSVPQNFINFILQYKAFQLAVKTGHYTEAIKYWRRFFGKIKNVETPNCGCNG